MKLSLKQIRTGLVMAALLLLSGWIGWRIGRTGTTGGSILVSRSQPADKQTIDLSLYWQVWDKLHESYLEKEALDPKALIYGSIKGMAQALGDPYTVFLPPQDNQESKDELNGEFEGVGIQLGFIDQTLAVIAPLAGTPAAKAGILAGDLILHLKDEVKDLDRDTAGLSLPEAVDLIRGPKGSEIQLTLLRQNLDEPLEVNLKRDTIIVKSVELEWLGDNQDIARIILSRFGGRTEAEWQEAVNEIAARRHRGIILDLRNNPGGYLQGAIELAGEFLPAGKLVVKQLDSRGRGETYSVDRQGKLLTDKLVILVNQGSASSSEILAGALKDHGRAILVGQKTFGKGTVQEAIDIGNGAGLHVTTAKWLLPDGGWVNETEGLTPDIEVEDDPETETDEPLIKAMEQI